MRMTVLAILLGVANPACAQLSRHVVAEQTTAEIPSALDKPLGEPKAVKAPPATHAALKPEMPRPNLRTPTADKLFWLHASAFAGSMALDAWSTSRFVNFDRSHANSEWQVPGMCTEGNRSLGRTPTDGRIAGYFAAWTGSELAATYVLKKITRHFRPRWARESWRAPISYFTAYHTLLGLRNLNDCR